MHFTTRTPKDTQRRYGAVMNKINYLKAVGVASCISVVCNGEIPKAF